MMTFIRDSIARARLITTLAIGATALLGGYATAHSTGDDVRPVFSGALPNVPGKVLSAVVVNYAPGAKSAAHHHSGSVFAFILSGAVRSEVTPGGAVKVYKAGESFFEPPGSSHLVSENASTTEPASLLAVFVADEGATLTMPGAAQP
jgi:quercetin dioxygenase-like cupin family protein